MTFAEPPPIISFETLRNDLWQARHQIRNASGVCRRCDSGVGRGIRHQHCALCFL